jgi:hypothetical protein
MREPFIFRKVIYLVEATGRRAATLDELLRGVNTVDVSSINYHMHREFLAHRFFHPEYPNDFAHWVGRLIGDEMLAERLANLNVFRFRSLEGLRLELARMIADHLNEVPESAAERAPRGREFYFQSARSVVMECRQVATDLDGFIAALAAVPASSIYFHMFETRFGGHERPNDFAEWLGRSLGLAELANHVAHVDPYMFSLEEARRKLLQIVHAGVPRAAESR